MTGTRDPANDPRLEQAAEAIRKSDEKATAGQLALEMIHEIKNPLEALGHLVFLAQHDAGSPDDVRQYMSLAEEQMDLLRNIAKETLGFARSAQSPRPVRGSALIESALRIHQRAVDAKHIRLKTRFAPGIVAEVYPSEILQVLSNLIVNALDALEPSGSLHLRLRKANGGIHFIVADSGRGIPPENIGRLFEPFFTTKEDGGNGLGLALSRRIVERHGGRIRVRSCTRPGRSGTTFLVSLPACR
jgi:signal transduction histidine kinase